MRKRKNPVVVSFSLPVKSAHRCLCMTGQRHFCSNAKQIRPVKSGEDRRTHCYRRTAKQTYSIQLCEELTGLVCSAVMLQVSRVRLSQLGACPAAL